MTLQTERLKAFQPKHRTKSADPSEDQRMLEAAQDVGVAMKMMREARKISIEYLAEKIGMSAETLKRAEAGQLVERTEDGRLIDCPGALLEDEGARDSRGCR
jgi:ribosome-binding protein aMBF1 (putative translation factor)